MATNTTKLGLRKPGENDFYNQQTEQADNWEKVDKFADDIQNLVDNNSGKKITGYIQDSVEKILGNYYLDKLATGLFKCIKSGNINYNSSEYFEDYSNYANGNKLQNLQEKSVLIKSHSDWIEMGSWGVSMEVKRYAKNGVTTKEEITITRSTSLGTQIPAGEWNFNIIQNSDFPGKYWGPPTSVGTDDPALAFQVCSVVGSPSSIYSKFAKTIPGSTPFTLTLTWIYNL